MMLQPGFFYDTLLMFKMDFILMGGGAMYHEIFMLAVCWCCHQHTRVSVVDNTNRKHEMDSGSSPE